MKKVKMISFRVTQDEVDLIEKVKKEQESDIRSVSDSDVLHYALALLDESGNKRKIPKEKEHFFLDYFGDEALPLEMVKKGWKFRDDGILCLNGSPEKYVPPGIEDLDNNGHFPGEVPKGYLSEEEKALGYQWLKGDLCDKDGYPVEQMAGDVLVRGGEAYVTDPGRKALKEQAKENSSKLLIDTPGGRMNEAMRELIVPIMREEVQNPHNEGMLTRSWDGVDESPDDFDS